MFQSVLNKAIKVIISPPTISAMNTDTIMNDEGILFIILFLSVISYIV